MAVFTDAEEVYDLIGGVFGALAADPDRARLARIGVVAQFRLTDPAAQITVPMNGDGLIEFGHASQQPDVVLRLSADLLHALFLGTANATVAMARGQIRTEGPVAKVLSLVSLVRVVVPAYRERLEATGRSDLIAA